MFASITTDIFTINLGKALFLVVGASSAIVGSVISEKVNRRKFLWTWIAFGAIATGLPAILQGSQFFLFISSILGISFGLGIPCCTAFLADCTAIEERARVSGIIILATFCAVFLISLAVRILTFGVAGLILLCAVRVTSFSALFLDPCQREEGVVKGNSWRSILKYKDFGLYIFPWLMFNVASGLIYFVWAGLPPEYSSVIAFGETLHFVGAAAFGFLSGVLADRLGRKLPIIVGLVMLGVSFALLGFVTSELSILVYLTTSGIAWGFLLVVFLAIPGDLAFPRAKERFYALGAVIPLTIWTGFSVVAELLAVGVAAGALSSILSIILFVSVIPVLFASETLPDVKMKSRKLRDYMKKVGKVIEESKTTETS
jgi:MFS family permease